MSIAFASDAASVAGTSSSLMSFLPMIAIFAIFYFMLIRPQMKKQRETQQMINSLQKGDTVVAAGGMMGQIVKIEDNVLHLEIAKDVKIKVAKNSVSERITDNKQPVESKPTSTTAANGPAKKKATVTKTKTTTKAKKEKEAAK